MKETITVALDAMGGDNAPAMVLEGALMVAKEVPEGSVRFLIVGAEKNIVPFLHKHPLLERMTTLIHTEDYVRSDENPADAIRKNKNSSMRLALNALKEGKADALVSAGNSGALMGMSKFVLKTLKGIYRPAMISAFPNIHKPAEPTVMLDLGANSECTVDNLVQFAVMGKVYAQVVYDTKNPSVGLLNIGTEVQKGNDTIRETAEILSNEQSELNYKGFVEGDDILRGKVNVIVADGFTGNVALKAIEGSGLFVKEIIRMVVKRAPIVYIAVPFLWFAYKRFMKYVDPRRQNGAMLIGLQGVVVKSHGGADVIAFSWAIKRAMKLIQGNVNGNITDSLENLTVHKKEG